MSNDKKKKSKLSPIEKALRKIPTLENEKPFKLRAWVAEGNHVAANWYDTVTGSKPDGPWKKDLNSDYSFEDLMNHLDWGKFETLKTDPDTNARKIMTYEVISYIAAQGDQWDPIMTSAGLFEHIYDKDKKSKEPQVTTKGGEWHLGRFNLNRGLENLVMGGYLEREKETGILHVTDKLKHFCHDYLITPESEQGNPPPKR